MIMKKISIVGIGKLGLCLALNLDHIEKYKVVGVDLNQNYIDSLNNNLFFSDEPNVNEYLNVAKYFEATTDLSRAIEDTEIIFIVVPTPSSVSGVYDQSYINTVVDGILSYGKSTFKKYIVIQSTVTPGYCQTLQEKISAFNYEVVYNPEFIAQGSIIRDQQNPDMVLIGEVTSEAGDKIRQIYSDMCHNDFYTHRMSLTEAEITKIALNCFVTTKIAFANTVGDLASKMMCDPDKILGALGSDSRVGPKYLKYGFGYGGPCFPRDNKAFGAVCEWHGIYPHIPYATDQSNQTHLINQVRNFSEIVPHSKPFIFDNVAFKEGSTIITESQRLEFALRLVELGYSVTLRDNESVINSIKQLHGNKFTYVMI
jgi:UDPglucose 6-dehydrogenase